MGYPTHFSKCKYPYIKSRHAFESIKEDIEKVLLFHFLNLIGFANIGGQHGLFMILQVFEGRISDKSDHFEGEATGLFVDGSKFGTLNKVVQKLVENTVDFEIVDLEVLVATAQTVIGMFVFFGILELII